MYDMETLILFLDPTDVEPASDALVKLGFAIENIGQRNIDEGPAIEIIARITVTRLSQSDFLDWITRIVEPLGGDVIEAGFTYQPTFA